MKKIYLLTIATIISWCSFGQFLESFESHVLSPESYDNGSGGGGDFVFGSSNEITLTNLYDTAWMSWTGFAISNVTDNTTPGFGNQYSAITGVGADSSENYAVFYLDGVLEASSGTMEQVLDSFKITNTTYAALSMEYGDAFAKKFGSPTDAMGAIDGTNGEDFFRVWIICEDVLQTEKDSIEFYLADYRFADSTQDYIVDTWTNIDLTTFAFGVSKVSFRLESSDNGSWGMNTPAYFAIDDVQYEFQIGIDELAKHDFSVYPVPFNDDLKINGGEGTIAICAMDGKVLYEGIHEGSSIVDTSKYPSGAYVATLRSSGGVFTQRILK